MKQILPVVAAFLGVFGLGAAHGLWTDRWKVSNEPEASAAKLRDVATTLGEWDGQEAAELDPQALKIGAIVGYINRHYVNRRTGAAVSVLIVCGRPGPISVHTPDICFRGQGFDFSAPPARQLISLDTGDVEFLHGRMHKPDSPGTPPQRIFWGWSAHGKWSAPENPRFAFARRPALFKMYLLRPLARNDEPVADDPCQLFLRVLIPELKRALFTAP